MNWPYSEVYLMTEQICDQNKCNFQENFKNPKEKNNSS